MEKKRNLIFLNLIFCIGFSCQERPVSDSQAVKEELRSREVVHLTPGQISQRAFELGDTLLTKAESEFYLALKRAKESPCEKTFLRVKNEFQLAYHVELNQYSFDKQKIANHPSGKEKQILEAYLYSHDHGLPIVPNFQKEGDSAYFFTKAFILKDVKSLTCFKEMSDSLSEPTLGDTVGVWTVRYRKKQVVMSFVD